jgi:hypothetical protein
MNLVNLCGLLSYEVMLSETGVINSDLIILDWLLLHPISRSYPFCQTGFDVLKSFRIDFTHLPKQNISIYNC